MSEWTELKNVSSAWPVPNDNLPGVQKRARALVRRRRILASAVSVLLILSVVGGALTWARLARTDSFQVQPAGDTVEGARAATFAFHALTETTDYVDPELGSFDYKSIDQTDTTEWRVGFEVGSDPQELRQLLRSRHHILRHIQKRKTPRPNEEQRLKDEIRDLESSLDEALAAGGPFAVQMIVEKAGETLQISEIEGPVAEDVRDKLLGFTQNVSDIQVQGTEHLRVHAKRGEGNFVSFTAGTWWTGPIPSSYREICLLSLVAPNGEVIYTQAESETTPQTAPDSEDFRDWGYGSSGAARPIEYLTEMIGTV